MDNVNWDEEEMGCGDCNKHIMECDCPDMNTPLTGDEH